MLSSTTHSMCIKYNPQTQQWILADVCSVPIKELNDLTHVKNYFSSSGYSIFSTQIFGCNKKALENLLADWRQTETFQRIHQVTMEKAMSVSWYSSGWIKIAASAGDIGAQRKLAELEPTSAFDTEVITAAIAEGQTKTTYDLLKRFQKENKTIPVEDVVYTFMERDDPNLMRFLIRHSPELKNHIKNHVIVNPNEENLGVKRVLLEYGARIKDRKKLKVLKKVDQESYNVLHDADGFFKKRKPSLEIDKFTKKHRTKLST